VIIDEFEYRRAISRKNMSKKITSTEAESEKRVIFEKCVIKHCDIFVFN